MGNQTRAEKLERLAFAYCRIATASLLFGKYTLPAAAILSAGLYIASHFKGQKETRCAFRFPLIAAGFWVFILACWIAGSLGVPQFVWMVDRSYYLAPLAILLVLLPTLWDKYCSRK